MSMKIITGKTGTPHIDSSDDAALYRAIIGIDYILPNGNKFSYEVIDNNTVKINDGDILIQGHLGRIVPGDYENVTINNGTQGMKRNDLIVARYIKNTETGFENMELAVIEGVSGLTATDPKITVEDLTNGGTIREIALYRVSLDGLSITNVISLFNISSTWNDFKKNGGSINGDINIPGALKNGNGFTKLTNGLILQWGYYVGQAQSDDRWFTLPTTFPNTCLSVVGSADAVDSATNVVGMASYFLPSSTSAIHARWKKASGEALIPNSVTVKFIAIGH